MLSERARRLLDLVFQRRVFEGTSKTKANTWELNLLLGTPYALYVWGSHRTTRLLRHRRRLFRPTTTAETNSLTHKVSQVCSRSSARTGLYVLTARILWVAVLTWRVATHTRCISIRGWYRSCVALHSSTSDGRTSLSLTRASTQWLLVCVPESMCGSAHTVSRCWYQSSWCVTYVRWLSLGQGTPTNGANRGHMSTGGFLWHRPTTLSRQS